MILKIFEGLWRSTPKPCTGRWTDGNLIPVLYGLEWFFFFFCELAWRLIQLDTLNNCWMIFRAQLCVPANLVLWLKKKKKKKKNSHVTYDSWVGYSPGVPLSQESGEWRCYCGEWVQNNALGVCVHVCIHVCTGTSCALSDAGNSLFFHHWMLLFSCLPSLWQSKVSGRIAPGCKVAPGCEPLLKTRPCGNGAAIEERRGNWTDKAGAVKTTTGSVCF